MNEIEKQVEAAFDYRGHVTLKMKNGEAMEGFVFNRQFMKTPEESFIEVFPKGSDEKKQIFLAAIQAIELTGENFAQPFTPAK